VPAPVPMSRILYVYPHSRLKSPRLIGYSVIPIDRIDTPTCGYGDQKFISHSRSGYIEKMVVIPSLHHSFAWESSGCTINLSLTIKMRSGHVLVPLSYIGGRRLPHLTR